MSDLIKTTYRKREYAKQDAWQEITKEDYENIVGIDEHADRLTTDMGLQMDSYFNERFGEQVIPQERLENKIDEAHKQSFKNRSVGSMEKGKRAKSASKKINLQRHMQKETTAYIEKRTEDRKNLMHYFDLLNEHLDASIALGYHAHNNFQMGYANCIAVLERKMNGDVHRPMLVDGSIYGMGKSAGNAPIELIAMFMNHRMGKRYGVSQILETIDSNISAFYQSATWGYNMFYYLAASNDCHPNYVSYLMQKQTLSVKSINDILGRLEGEKKLLYDRNVIERLYQDYQKNEVNDTTALSSLGEKLRGRPILLIGPGSSMKKQRKKVTAFYEAEKPTVISINRIPEYLKPDYIFLSNSKRYVGLATRLARERYSIIATSNVTPTSPDAFDFVLNFSSLIDEDAEFVDNSLAMFLKVLVSIGVPQVTLAGFDGYSGRRQNYADPNMEYDFVKRKADYLNGYMRGFLHDMQGKIRVDFLTETLY